MTTHEGPPMLHEFLTANRQELIDRCVAKVAVRRGPAPAGGDSGNGIPALLGQLIEALHGKLPAAGQTRIGSTANARGKELLQKGFSIDQVVHDYGDLCQALTELAEERREPITVPEFHTFNLCLDNAIAEAVTAFSVQHADVAADEGARTLNEQLGSLAHELRNHVNAATLAFHAIKTGTAAVGGATGALLDRSLAELVALVERSLAEVRLTAGVPIRRTRLELGPLLDEVSVFAAMMAKAKGLFYALEIEENLVVEVDRPLLSSAVSNLLQNAVKFTGRNGRVWLRARGVKGRVVIEVQDECGGLAPGVPELLFKAFEQHHTDRSGLGLGLSISRRAVEANGGTLAVEDLPDRGCVFSISLPRASAA
ncbi:MAG: HAMP domain-containing sensor histidine kinase [Polyangiales bacterium]